MNRIRQLRKQNKMTQKELANHLQIADSTLSYWEMGKYEPDIDALRNLAKIFHVSIDYIVGDDDMISGSISYHPENSQLHHNASLIASEPGIMYDTCRLKNDFNRDEFNNLTQNEIEKLAEYAQFIKSLKTQ